jgi:hypothetical protein
MINNKLQYQMKFLTLVILLLFGLIAIGQTMNQQEKVIVDFGTAEFIIDDTYVQNRNASVFKVLSGLQPFKIDGIYLVLLSYWGDFVFVGFYR